MRDILEQFGSGPVTVSQCSECGRETFSANGVCVTCQVEIETDDRRFFSERILDCE